MFIDLTLTVDINNPVINKASNDQNSYMSKGHIGTHLDVYIPQPRPPVEFAETRGVLIDASLVNRNEIGVDILEGKDIGKNDFLIIYADWLEHYEYGSKEYFRDHPQFTWELIEELQRRQLAFLGVDFAGIRRGEEHARADQMMAAANSYVIENMANVRQLRDVARNQAFRMLTGWTGFEGSSGLSCRVVADVRS